MRVFELGRDLPSPMIHLHPQPDAALAARLSTLPGLLPEHDPRWLRVLADGLDHRTYALVAEAKPADASPRASAGSSRVTGYLPLALVRSALFGRFLVSLPYLNRAGLVAADDATARALLAEAMKLADRHNVQYLELRHAKPADASPRASAGSPLFTHEKSDKVRMVLDLPADEAALSKAVGAKVRNQVKKGDRFDLALTWGGLDVLDRFYDVFAVNMRDLGTPVYPQKLFAAILEHFRGEAELAVVTHVQQPVAVALLVHQQGQTQVPSASSLRTFNHTSANMWMYHRLLLRAIEHGSATFDFGRSTPASGTYQFKRQWGCREEPTTWQYVLRRGELDAVRPDSPKMQRRIAAWQRLPVWVTRLVGPSIVRGIP